VFVFNSISQSKPVNQSISQSAQVQSVSIFIPCQKRIVLSSVQANPAGPSSPALILSTSAILEFEKQRKSSPSITGFMNYAIQPPRSPDTKI
jgi:hypothetical protein